VKEILQILAIPLFAVAMALHGAERRTVRRLRKAEATSPETAVERPRTRRLGRWQLARLEKAGALVRTDDGRWYFVAEGYAGFRRKRRKRAAVVLGLLAVIVVALLLAGRSG
jgi:hypothetical protein